MYNGTADRFMYDGNGIDDEEIVQESAIAGFKHQRIDPLTGLDEVLMETWLFEDEDAEFLEERAFSRIFYDALRKLNE